MLQGWWTKFTYIYPRSVGFLLPWCKKKFGFIARGMWDMCHSCVSCVMWQSVRLASGACKEGPRMASWGWQPCLTWSDLRLTRIAFVLSEHGNLHCCFHLTFHVASCLLFAVFPFLLFLFHLRVLHVKCNIWRLASLSGWELRTSSVIHNSIM